jgi:hypothetical protein
MVKSERFVHQPADFRVAEMTSASAFIKVRLQYLMPLQVIFHVHQRFPFRAQRGGIGIRQMKRNELNQSRLITMRKVTPLMPAPET